MEDTIRKIVSITVDSVLDVIHKDYDNILDTIDRDKLSNILSDISVERIRMNVEGK
jgi:hypothetical protein